MRSIIDWQQALKCARDRMLGVLRQNRNGAWHEIVIHIRLIISFLFNNVPYLLAGITFTSATPPL